MGSFDGAEVYELVGLFILHYLRTKFKNKNNGFYRDDGLAAFQYMGPRTAEKIKKQFLDCLQDLDLKITCEANLKIVNYLDVTFNLSTEKYCPYRKADNPPMFINTSSNQPPSILKHLPNGIGNRISSLSYDESEFERSALIYKNALKTSGFKSTSQYTKPGLAEQQKHKEKKRSRKILWLNPPYSRNVETNIGKCFLRLVDKHFPTAHRLHKIFNRKKLKVSYGCTENIAQIIKQHNKKVLEPDPPAPVTTLCNCREKPNCPL